MSVTGIGRNQSADTISELAHIMQKNRMKNLSACFAPLSVLPKMTFLLMRKLIPPETTRAISVASIMLKNICDGRIYANIVNKTRSIIVQPIDAVANLNGVL